MMVYPIFITILPRTPGVRVGKGFYIDQKNSQNGYTPEKIQTGNAFLKRCGLKFQMGKGIKLVSK